MHQHHASASCISIMHQHQHHASCISIMHQHHASASANSISEQHQQQFPIQVSTAAYDLRDSLHRYRPSQSEKTRKHDPCQCRAQSADHEVAARSKSVPRKAHYEGS
eukprot:490608-Rhodomonas_salina.1